ncbi:MAG: hypothetical protein K2P70_15875 [Hyphomonadaceae bacterium]|nr:hypothetical protein [Hyphomonadaceae bacterium]
MTASRQISRGRKVTLSDLAAIGNFIGGVAVVVSFVFLAFQLRQNTHNQRTSIAIQRTALTQELSISTISDNLEIWVRGGAADQSLTTEDVTRYQAVALMTFWLYEEHYYQRRDGMLDDERWATNINRLRAFMSLPGYRAAWRSIAELYFEAEFRRSVDEVMHAATATAEADAGVKAWKALAVEELAAARAAHDSSSRPLP